MSAGSTTVAGAFAAKGIALHRSRRRNQILGLTLPGTLWLLVFFAVPMFFVLRTSLDSFADAQIVQNFTLANYERVCSRNLFMRRCCSRAF
jgi:ABC-type spermidine/putrescine transport system permease subunit I